MNIWKSIGLVVAITYSPLCVSADEEGGHSEHASAFVELGWGDAAQRGVKVVPAGLGTVKQSIVLNGEVSLNGDSVVHVSPRFAGVLKRVEKNLGDDVKTGDLLAIIQSNESLTTYEIRSEVNGTIIEKDATRGEYVRDDKVLFVVADLSTMWINAAVYLDDLRSVAVGKEVRISSRSVSGVTRATISYLRPSLSELTRTALVRMVVANEHRRWLPGMFVRLEAEGSPVSVTLAVPSSAVRQAGAENLVFVKAMGSDGDEGFARKEVVVGLSDGVLTEIKDGLTPGEEVASGNTFLLKAELGKGSASHED